MASKKAVPKPVEPVPSRRDDLLELRAALRRAMLDAEPSVMAQIAGQLRQVVKELSELPPEREQSALARAQAKREARRSNLKAV